MDNGYPLSFIFSTINYRLRGKIFNDSCSDSKVLVPTKKFFTVPYVKNVSERFSKVISNFDFTMAYSCSHPLKRFIKVGKDKLDNMSHSDVVYKISCSECEVTYVGQTKRQLGTRVKEHRTDINKKSASPSVISCHRLETNHEFDWENTKILDEEPSFYKRIVSEMVHIKRQNAALNKQNDTALLSDEYLQVLNLFPTP